MLIINKQTSMVRLWIFIALCFLSLTIHLNQQIHEDNLIQSEQFESLRESQLDKHNIYRSKHGCEPLLLNSTLNAIAQNYSEYLATTVHNLSHSQQAKSGEYGENLYWAQGSPTQTYVEGQASDSWYSQQSQYTYGSFPPTDGTGHFTAMIWKSVTSVGFGYYKIEEKGGQAIYVVANYYPAPNFYSEEQYTLNVPRPSQIVNNSSQNPLPTLNETPLQTSPQNLNDLSLTPLAFTPSENDPFSQNSSSYTTVTETVNNTVNDTSDYTLQTQINELDNSISQIPTFANETSQQLNLEVAKDVLATLQEQETNDTSQQEDKKDESLQQPEQNAAQQLTS